MKTKIILVDDHTIIRESFRSLLESQQVFEVVGEADNGRDAIHLAGELSPDVIIMDIELRDSELTGIEATRKIHEQNESIKIIALSMMDKLSHIRGMVRAGASGYLCKDCTTEELIEAIETVLKGKNYFTKDAERRMQKDYLSLIRDSANTQKNALTGREVQILRSVAMGKNSKQIGDTLKISPKTVDTHRRSLMDKLKIFSVAELTKYAIREKIIDTHE